MILVHRHAWADARAGAARHACPTWIRPAPGIDHCLGGDCRPDIPGCHECRPPGSELERGSDRRIADRAHSPPTRHTNRGHSPADRVRPGMPAIGRPAVLLRGLHHARRHWVQLYVAHTGSKEILVRLHETRLVAPSHSVPVCRYCRLMHRT